MMNKVKKLFACLYYDAKMQGPNLFVPVYVMILFNVYIITLKLNNTLEYEYFITPAEIFLPIMAAWWSIFLLQSMLEFKEGNTFFTFPTSTFFYGILRESVCFFAYIILLTVECSFLSLMSGLSIGLLWLQISLQSIFFCGLGFFSMALSRNCGIAVVVVTFYCLAYQLASEIMPVDFNVYLKNTTPIALGSLFQLLPKLLFLCVPLWTLGHLFLASKRRLKGKW